MPEYQSKYGCECNRPAHDQMIEAIVLYQLAVTRIQHFSVYDTETDKVKQLAREAEDALAVLKHAALTYYQKPTERERLTETTPMNKRTRRPRQRWWR